MDEPLAVCGCARVLLVDGCDDRTVPAMTSPDPPRTPAADPWDRPDGQTHYYDDGCVPAHVEYIEPPPAPSGEHDCANHPGQEAPPPDQMTALERRLSARVTELEQTVRDVEAMAALAIPRIEAQRAELARLNAQLAHTCHPDQDHEAWRRERDEARAQLAQATAVVEAASRLRKGKYLPWSAAGGPKECRHGTAEGIDCQLCDAALVTAYDQVLDQARAPGEPQEQL